MIQKEKSRKIHLLIEILKAGKFREGIDNTNYLYVKNQAIGKGIWWMPRQSEAKKDVIHCEKPWGVVNKH